MSAVRWFFGTKAKYNALAKANQLHPEGMYFLNDTGEYYYKGEQYMGHFIYFTGDLPSSGITTDHVYFNTSTLTGYTYDGTKWNILVEPASVSVLTGGVAGVPQMVTGAAAKAYIDDYVVHNNDNVVININWDETNNQLKFSRMADEANGVSPTALNVIQFAASITRDASTGDITLIASDGVTVLATINIALDNYIISGSYDNTKKAIVFKMSNGEDVLLYAADIINLYNRANTTTVETTISSVDGLSFIEMNVKVSQDTGNELYVATTTNGLAYTNPRTNQKIANEISGNQVGLYVNRAHLIDFLLPANNGEIGLLDTEGNAKASGRKIGGSTLSQTAELQAVTQVTEEALNNTKEDILTNLEDTYVAKTSLRNQYANFAAAYRVQVL